MSAVVCLNLYIALMSDTFARVYENAKANAIMQQAMQILNIERTLSKKKLMKVKKFIAKECAPQVSSTSYRWLLSSKAYLVTVCSHVTYSHGILSCRDS